MTEKNAEELHRIINRTRATYPSRSTVKELFERVAAHHPRSVAVVCATERLTYSELNSRANRAALDLREYGVRRGTVVGLAMPRSVKQMIYLLAIVKCGGIYLPVDPSWPRMRLESILAQAGCNILLTDERASNASELDFAVAVSLAHHSDVRTANLPTVGAADDIAYINFTSGSTGAPKGVPIRNRSIARLVFGSTYTKLGLGTVLLQLAPTFFDAATFEIWGALLNGGTCILYPYEYLTASSLKEVIRQEAITDLFLTTALFNTVVEVEPGALLGVGTVLTGGEAHSPKHMEAALAVLRPPQIVHVYGPTECTTFATRYVVRDVDAGAVELPIGVPIQNTVAYVFDGERLCGAGEVGELLLGGPGLSPGYVGAPDLTQQSFVEVEIPQMGTKKLYRTGDFVYVRPDGNIVFQGRRDDQIKISGHRIELSEVMFHLARAPGVQFGFVTLVSSQNRENRTIAFVVPGALNFNSDNVDQYLNSRLPRYMMPTRIYVCENGFPYTASGKVDREVLLRRFGIE